MSVPDRLRALDEALQGDPEAARRAAELVATLRHDLANLFGTFTMEAHLLGHIVPMLERAAEQGDLAALRQRIGELRETSANLAEAGDRARAFLALLRRETL